MVNKGCTTADIANELRTTRQFINQTKLSAEAKLSTTLLDVAQANDLQITKRYPKNGLLLAYHPALKRRAILTYSTNYGIKVWYWYDNPEDITDPTFLNKTHQYLIDLAKERNINIQNADKIHPSKLAHHIFLELIPELKPQDKKASNKEKIVNLASMKGFPKILSQSAHQITKRTPK